MAGFTKKQLENLTLQPENLASIKDAVQETFYKDEDFSSFVNIMKVKNDDPIALQSLRYLVFARDDDVLGDKALASCCHINSF